MQETFSGHGENTRPADSLSKRPGGSHPDIRHPIESAITLSPVQQKMLEFLALGMGAKEMAEALGLDREKIISIKQNLFQRFGMSRGGSHPLRQERATAALVEHARKLGMLGQVPTNNENNKNFITMDKELYDKKRTETILNMKAALGHDEPKFRTAGAGK
jgi:DNA-binding CsgD family transcriptional regulator